MSRAAGFALPLALVLLVVLALLLAQALGGVAGDAALAANQQFREAAFEAAESGLVAAKATVAASPALPSMPIERSVSGSEVERSSTRISVVGDDAAPTGYSLDRFELRHLDLRSTGRAARGTTVTLVEGVDQVALRP
jgi:Tfp pilus assembly protein PilX